MWIASARHNKTSFLGCSMSKADVLLKKAASFEKLAILSLGGNPVGDFLSGKKRPSGELGNLGGGVSGTFDIGPGNNKVTVDPEIGVGGNSLSLSDAKDIVDTVQDVPQIATDIYGRLTNPYYDHDNKSKQNERVKNNPNKRTYTVNDPIWKIRQKVKQPVAPAAVAQQPVTPAQQQPQPPQQVAQQQQTQPVAKPPVVPVKPASIIDYLIKKYG